MITRDILKPGAAWLCAVSLGPLWVAQVGCQQGAQEQAARSAAIRPATAQARAAMSEDLPFDIDQVVRSVSQASLAGNVSMSEERGLDQPIQSPVVNKTDQLAVSFNGSLYLVTWLSVRDGGYAPRLLATRVTPGGTVLDPEGIVLGHGSDPVVAGGEGTFLVFFRHYDEDERWYYPPTLRGVLVSNGGHVLTPAGLDLGRTWFSAVAFDGTQYQVFWNQDGTMYRARITTEGVVLDPGGTAALAPNAYDGGNFVATCAAGSCILVWKSYASEEDHDELRSIVLDAQGAVRGPGVQVLEIDAEREDDEDEWELGGARVTFDGTNYVVAWSAAYEGDDDFAGSLPGPDNVVDPDRRRGTRARRISPQGVLLDADIVLLWDWAMEIDGMVHDGTHILVVGRPWGECEARTVAVRMSPEGVPLDHEPHVLADNGLRAVVAAGRRRTFMAWMDQSASPSTTLHAPIVVGAWLNPAGTALDGPSFPLELAANGQQEPFISFDGQNYLVTWQDHRRNTAGGLGGIYGVRVTPAGQVLDPQGIEIAANQPMQLKNQPRAAFDGQNTVVVWGAAAAECNGGTWPLEAVRLGPDGNVLDPQPIPLPMEHYEGYAIAGAHGGVLLASESTGVPVHMDQTGALTELPALWELEGVRSAYKPAIASNGTDFLIVFYDMMAAYASLPAILAVRVSGQGELLDQRPIILGKGGASFNGNELTAGFDGQNYVVAWKEIGRFGGVAIHVARVSAEGQVRDLGGIPVAGTGSSCTVPNHYISSAALTFDGKNTIVTWQDQPVLEASPYQYLGVTFSPEGTVGTCFSIASTFQDHNLRYQLGLASAGGGSSLVAYTRHVEEAPFQNRRVRVRVLESAATAPQ